MLKNDLICTDIRIGNLGYDSNNNVVLFDIQGLRHYSDCKRDRLQNNINNYLKAAHINKSIKLSHSREECMKDIHKLIDGFKLLGDKTPVQVKKEPWDAMWETLEKML